jgi:putative transposase
MTNALTAYPCDEALEEAIVKYGALVIIKTDKGSQFTSAVFNVCLSKTQCRSA